MCKTWKNIIENLPHFKKDLHLRLSGWVRHSESDFTFLSKTSTKFYQLSLIQIDYRQIPLKVWELVCPRLKVLTFRYCLKMGLQDFYDIFKLCKDVEQIQIYDHFPPLGPGYRFNTYKHFTWPVQTIRQFEMIRASAVDNLKLKDFLMNMSELEFLRIESESFSRMEDIIYEVIRERSMTLRSLLLVDNKECAGADMTLKFLISLAQFPSRAPALIRFGCRLKILVMTPVLKEFLSSYGKIRIFEVWTDEPVLEPQFLFDMFDIAYYLRQIIVHCDQFHKTFTRPEVQMYQRRKLKKIVFFPD